MADQAEETANGVNNPNEYMLEDEYSFPDEPEEKVVVELPAPKVEEEESDNEKYGRRVQERFKKMSTRHYAELKVERDRIQALEATVEELKAHNSKEVLSKQTGDIESIRQGLLERKQISLDIGDHADVIKIDEELLELMFRARDIAQQNKAETQTKPADTEQKTAVSAQPEVKVNLEAMTAWEAANPWVYDPAQKASKDIANTVLSQLLSEGFEIDDPQTFVELNAELSLRFKAPEHKQPEQKTVQQTQTRVRPQTAPVERGQTVVQTSAAGMTPEEKNAMVGFGLDPSNDAHRVSWLKQRASK